MKYATLERNPLTVFFKYTSYKLISNAREVLNDLKNCDVVDLKPEIKYVMTLRKSGFDLMSHMENETPKCNVTVRNLLDISSAQHLLYVKTRCGQSYEFPCVILSNFFRRSE